MDQIKDRRTPKYLSPSSVATFFTDPTTWYIRYIAPVKLPKEPQTKQMAIGSAFDAYVKAHLYDLFIGDKAPKYELDALLTQQVEPQNLELARVDGLCLFTQYKKTGALDFLISEIKKAVDKPKFEFDLEQHIVWKDETIQILGKPDLFFTLPSSRSVILDWKVNGFYGSSPVIPKQQYVRQFSKSKGKLPAHKNAVTLTYDNLTINFYSCFSTIDPVWARQLATYAWLAGEEIGGDFIVGIDQSCGNLSYLTFAQHRSLISKNFQHKVADDYYIVHRAIKTGHYFVNLTRSESDKLANDLDDKAIQQYGFYQDDDVLSNFTHEIINQGGVKQYPS